VRIVGLEFAWIVLMKKWCSVPLLLTLSFLSLAAQNGMPSGHQMLADPDKFADGHVAALERQVELSPDQKTILRPVFLDEGKKLFAILNSTTMPTEQKQAAIEQLHAETAAKVGSLLTPEQRRQMTPVPTGQRKAAPAGQT